MRVPIALATTIALRLSLAQGNLASINGRIQDITGAAIVGAEVELRLERVAVEPLKGKTDATGTYAFHGLAAGEYTLRFLKPGFKLFTLKSVRLLRDEHRSLPAIELSVAEFAWCPGRAVLDYVRLLQSPDKSGNLGGIVREHRGPPSTDGPPVSNAEVVLMCSAKIPCRATISDVQGHFLFVNVPQGEHSIRVTHSGFYTEIEPGYSTQLGREMVYRSITLERCFKGNCDPAKRPKKPPLVCE